MKTFKKLLLIFSLFLIFFFGEIAVNIACGPEADPYDYYVSFFHNNIQGDDYTPFSYNRMVNLFSNQEVESEAEVNSTEWANYLKVKKEDVFEIMYNTDSSSSDLLSKIDIKNIEKLPDSLKNNSFIQGLKKNNEALKYFNFAKSCEPLATNGGYYWDPKPRDSSAMIPKACDALDLINTVKKDDFLKLRYAYQASRMFYYAGDLEQCKNTYSQFIKRDKSNSAVKGWGLSLYAGTMRQMGNQDESAYLFSKVFEDNSERRISAYRNYHYTGSNLKEVLKFAQTNNDKATIYAINGFRNPDFNLDNLIKVYQYNPKSLLVGALLIREVNKLEENLISNSDIAKNFYSAYSERYEEIINRDSIKKANLLKLQKIKSFSLALASDKKYSEPEFGTLTAAYLSWLEKKDDMALNYLKTLNPDKLSDRLRDQYRITDLLIKAKRIKKGTFFNENDLLSTLKWLDKKRFTEQKDQPKDDYYYEDWGNGIDRFTKTTRNFYQQILAPAYLKIGDTAKAALAMLKGDAKYNKINKSSLFANMSYQTIAFWQQYLTPKSMQGLAVYKTKAFGNDVTALLAKALNQLKNDDFYELYGTTYLRTHQYDKAAQMFAKVSPNYTYFNPENWYAQEESTKLYANPFVQTINDYPKKYVPANASITKKSFAVEMLRLQKLTVSDKKNAALYYYKMANAVYQTGYFGNSWFLISYDWSSYDNYSPAKYGYDVDYKKAQTAKNWYLKARALSTNADFKAKCTFMLAKCAQKQIIMDSKSMSFGYYDKDDVKFKDFIRANYNNPYFKELKLKYSKTPFYQTASTECSYLGDFIAGK